MKEPIRLRRRKNQSGVVSLYLDIYIHGVRSYEYLNLYLVPERTKSDKDANRETLSLAEAIRAKRLVEIRNNVFGFSNAGSGEDVLFLDFFDSITEERAATPTTSRCWVTCRRYLLAYDKKLAKRTLGDINQSWVKGFRDFLAHATGEKTDNALEDSSRQTYYSKLRACIHAAVERGLITTDPTRGIKGFKVADSQRMYLTIDEVRRLVGTPCCNETTKAAFLFSCLTGLRYSDIARLAWNEVHKQGDYVRIIFRQKKTGGQEYLDITPEAAQLMGHPRRPSDHVFQRLGNDTTLNRHLRQWCSDARIDKRITFHCGRHTFATMMLDLGTDIYTVSKLLGHREISTTQIYAKVLDKSKQEAVSRIPSIFAGKEG